jgi:soluble lytic murein transglycosylase-like protein
VAEVSEARDWARRVALSALAGGGLTAIGLGGPLGAAALATEAPSPGAGAQPGATGTPSQAQGAAGSTTPTSTAPASGTAPQTTGTTPAVTAQATSTPVGASPTTSVPNAPNVGLAHPKAPGAPEVVAQRKQRATQLQAGAEGAGATPQSHIAAPHNPAVPANIAPAPRLAATVPASLALLSGPTDAFARALGFYRIPLFLLPIYKAAAAQYGVPWEILAAINEVETNYGTDLSVSTAGAVGWMQFMPETWLQYGVDALGAGYADPYNPVDAIFAAARYLRAAGASTSLRNAVFAYNHSEAYVESVLLRARLIASYPPSVIATLTGLTDGRPPVAGARLAVDAQASPPSAGSANATAGAVPAAAGTPSAATAPSPSASPVAPSPQASGSGAEGVLDAPAPSSQLSELLGPSDAPVVAVEDGRVVALGASRKIGNYLVLRDVYGDVFTYAGLGSIAPFYRLPRAARPQAPRGAIVTPEAAREQAPSSPASSGSQPSVSLHVAGRTSPAGAGSPVAGAPAAGGAPASGPPAQPPSAGAGVPPAGAGKVRVFAHPGNPDARAAVEARIASLQASAAASGWSPLQRGSVLARGTVLGHLGAAAAPGATMRFAIRPAGAQSAIDPQPILENWSQLNAALHPAGATNNTVLAGATASDVFHLSDAELERTVLADPGIVLGACDRSQIAAGRVDARALAVLAFLSRSGLAPTVGRLRCGRGAHTAQGAAAGLNAGETIDITAINGVPISNHQGAGTITDMTIRALLTLQGRFAPRQIVSLMKYPNAPTTVAQSEHGDYIEVELAARGPRQAGASAAHAATATSGGLGAGLSDLQWQHLVTQIASLPQPHVSRTPSAAAVRVAGR